MITVTRKWWAGFVFRALVLAFTAGLLSAGSAWADTVSFKFVNGINANTSLGSSFTFTATSTGGTSVSLPINAWSGLPTETSTQNIFAKSAGTDETGLGVKNGGGSLNEIAGNYWLQMDTQDLVKKGFLSGTVSFGSVQAGESWAIWGSNTPGTVCTNIVNCFTKGAFLASGGSSTDMLPEALAGLGTYRYIGFTAPTGSVLLLNNLELKTTPTPEPPTFSLLVLGLVGLSIWKWRRMLQPQF